MADERERGHPVSIAALEMLRSGGMAQARIAALEGEVSALRASVGLLAATRARLAEAERWRAVANELAEALRERGEHEWSCARADFRGGRPREGGGYEFNFHGHWYEERPVDRTPKCDCEIGPALARFDAMTKEFTG